MSMLLWRYSLSVQTKGSMLKPEGKAAIATLLAAAAAGFCTLAYSQSSPVYPSRPIRMIVPVPAAGPNDFVARTVGDYLSKSLGQPVVVENRPGANSMIGTDYVSKQPPDGYTLLQTAASIILNDIFPPKPPYDGLKDFDPITRAVSTTFMLTVNPSVKAANIREFIAQARANPGKFTYATVGIGSPHHLSGELFQHLTGTKLLQVNYKGGAQITQALMSAEVDSTFISTFPVKNLVLTGKLRGLGVTTRHRSPLLPDVPTIAEAVPLPGYEVDIWQGFFAPARTPVPVITRLNRDINDALRDPRIGPKLAEQGLDPSGTTADEFRQILRQDMAKWSKLIKDANIKVE
jgi:tripartite-type tricarboxylate transporter receptor subunit TctC